MQLSKSQMSFDLASVMTQTCYISMPSLSLPHGGEVIRSRWFFLLDLLAAGGLVAAVEEAKNAGDAVILCTSFHRASKTLNMFELPAVPI